MLEIFKNHFDGTKEEKKSFKKKEETKKPGRTTHVGFY